MPTPFTLSKLTNFKIGLNPKKILNICQWESSMITEFDSIPYSNAGRGLQCLLKTELAL